MNNTKNKSANQYKQGHQFEWITDWYSSKDHYLTAQLSPQYRIREACCPCGMHALTIRTNNNHAVTGITRSIYTYQGKQQSRLTPCPLIPDRID